MVAAHLQWHLERGLRSLPLVDRDTNGSRVSRSGAGDAIARGPAPAEPLSTTE
jgi:DNA repair protein RecO (recombination protein O)